MEMIKPNLLAISTITVALGVTTLSGCSRYSKDQTAHTTPTLADLQASQVVFKNQASRNNGAWGAVYMTKEELKSPRTNIVDISSLPAMAEDVDLQQWLVKFEGSLEGKTGFFSTSGKKLYDDSCAACHMQDGKGAQGAGYYPPLANNSKMQSKYYIISVILNSLRGMPSFHSMMNDEQIASVTQYVHSDLNNFTDTVTAANIAQLRHDFPPGSDPSE
ncbi:cytochrome c [Psychrobacter sp. AH5]|uniref:c-type cytochrome n=1 Tax=Psychrobacter sp. AH5 TaxID=2937433 RepID=UPI0035303474